MRTRLTDVRIFILQPSDDDLQRLFKAALFLLQVRHEHKRTPLVPPTAPRAPPASLREERLEDLELLLVFPQDAKSGSTFTDDAREDMTYTRPSAPTSYRR